MLTIQIMQSLWPRGDQHIPGLIEGIVTSAPTVFPKYGLTPLAVLQADMIESARLLGWAGQIGELKPGYYADIVAVPGNPLNDISVVEHVKFVMKGGEVVRQ